MKEESSKPKEEYKIEGIKTVKPATPKSKAPTATVMSSQSKVDPQNYFQVLDHKYANSLESQGQASNMSSEISGALPPHNPSEILSRGGTTSQTKCTSEESKKTRKDQVPASRLVALAEQATSNQEIIKMY